MPTDIQSGSVADKLRNFFNAVGRIRTTLDEVVVPTANLVNLDAPPYRTVEQNFMGRIEKAAVVGNLSFAGVHMPAGAGGVAVIRKVIISNVTGAAQPFSIFIIPSPVAIGTYAAVSSAPNVENMNQFSGAAVEAFLPPVLYTHDEVGPVTYRRLAQIRLLTDTTLIIPVEIALRSGLGANSAVAGPAIAVSCSTANTVVQASFAGTYYPTAR